MKSGAWVILLGSVCLLCERAHAESKASTLANSRNSALESIRIEDLRQHVNFLASDALEGREAASRGGRAASIYLAQQLKKHDLAGGASERSFIQEIPGEMRNVLGILPGRDPRLQHEYLVICAHYDHVGYGSSQNSNGPTGYIHNGADDNASGVSVVLEIMEAFRKLPTAPRRSVLFAFWDGEENNLLGSRHWVTSPTVPLAQVKMCINLDMVGRLKNERVELIGTRTGFGLRELLARHNQVSGLKLDFPWEVPDNSDHQVFFERRIPILVPFTGFHDDYHRPSDDPDRLNLDGMRRIGSWMFSLLLDLSENEAAVPQFRPESLNEGKTEEASQQQVVERDSPIGLGWREDAAEPGTMQITQVGTGTRAERSGVRAGDRLYSVGKSRVRNSGELGAVFEKSRNSIELLIERGGGFFTVTLPQAADAQPKAGEPNR